ncbi:hypothetical protein ACJX0J_024352, partial [Zea mays]
SFLSQTQTKFLKNAGTHSLNPSSKIILSTSLFTLLFSSNRSNQKQHRRKILVELNCLQSLTINYILAPLLRKCCMMVQSDDVFALHNSTHLRATTLSKMNMNIMVSYNLFHLWIIMPDQMGKVAILSGVLVWTQLEWGPYKNIIMQHISDLQLFDIDRLLIYLRIQEKLIAFFITQDNIQLHTYFYATS